jgi:thiol:disulfide interchange protein DsbC
VLIAWHPARAHDNGVGRDTPLDREFCMFVFNAYRAAVCATALAVGATLLVFSQSALAQEAAIRKAIAERLPKLPPIDEVSKTPIPGLWEVRYGGAEIFYSDDKGDFIIVNGSLVETKTRTDLTEARVEKLLAISFDKLPLKDAIVIKQGNGSRKLAVFADPNCGYCKRFEKDLAGLKDVTVYTFVIPILGPDSTAKARDLWCAKDAAKSWRGWMIDGAVAAKAAATCDAAAIDRNLAFARIHRINGTPALIFEDGTRKPGALPLAAVESLLVAAATPAKK